MEGTKMPKTEACFDMMTRRMNEARATGDKSAIYEIYGSKWRYDPTTDEMVRSYRGEDKERFKFDG